MHANPDCWGTRAKPSALGLTLADINVGKYGMIPERGDVHGSMAPRGLRDPGRHAVARQPLRLVPLDEVAGQLDADRFYRYIESLQEFFNEAARVETRMAA